jgi:hypothetical protein
LSNLFSKVFLVSKGAKPYTKVPTSVAEPHHFYAAPAPGENFDEDPAPAAPAPASAAPAAAPTLLNSKAKFFKTD